MVYCRLVLKLQGLGQAFKESPSRHMFKCLELYGDFRSTGFLCNPSLTALNTVLPIGLPWTGSSQYLRCRVKGTVTQQLLLRACLSSTCLSSPPTNIPLLPLASSILLSGREGMAHWVDPSAKTGALYLEGNMWKYSFSSQLNTVLFAKKTRLFFSHHTAGLDYLE